MLPPFPGAKACLAFSVALCLQASTVAGQPAALRLSVADALARAAAGPDQQLANATLRRADGDLAVARATLRNRVIPSVSASLTYQRLLQNQYDEIGRRFGLVLPDSLPADPLSTVFNARNTLTATVEASLLLFDGGVGSAQAAAAAAAREQARLGSELTAAQVELDVVTSYMDVVLTRRVEAIAESTLVQAGRVLAIAEASVEKGRQPAFEVARARAAREAQRPAIESARTARLLAETRLRQLVGAPADVALELLDSLPGTEAGGTGPRAANAPPAGGSAAFARARAQAAEGVDAAEQSWRAAQRERLPSLRLSATHQRFAYPGPGSLGWTTFFPNTVISATLSVPLELTGRTSGAIRAARAALEESRARLVLLQQQAERADLLAHRALQEAYEGAQAARAGASAAARAFEIAEARYAAGRSSQLEVQDARLALASAQLQHARALRDHEVAAARLARLDRLPLEAR